MLLRRKIKYTTVLEWLFLIFLISITNIKHIYLHIGAWLTKYMKIKDLSWITGKIDYFKITTSLYCNSNFMTWDTRRLLFFLAWCQTVTSTDKTRDSPNLTLSHLRHKYFKNSFFPFAIVECTKSSPFILLKSGLRRVFNKLISFH